MSPRAAWRFESLGFAQVFHYVAGVADWTAAGLPVEGSISAVPTAGAAAQKETALCSPDDPVGEAASRAKAAGEDSCLVINDQQIVMGRLYYKDLEANAGVRVQDVMDPGPSTFRPNVPVNDIADFMKQHGLNTTPITTSEGRYVGMLHLEAADKIAPGGNGRQELSRQLFGRGVKMTPPVSVCASLADGPIKGILELAPR